MARRTDFALLGLTLLLLTIGLAMLYSTSAVLAQLRHHDSLYFLKRQLLWAGFGLLGLWAMRSIPYSVQRRLATPALLLTLIALVLVLLPMFGKEVGGARRWLMLGSLSVQPSEFAKYALLLYVARNLALNQERLDSFAHTYLPNMLVLAVTALLVFKQPDLGTAVVLAATASLQLLIAGVPWRYLACTALTGLPGLYWAVTHVRFRMGRLMVFLNPWEDRQGQWLSSGAGVARSGAWRAARHWPGEEPAKAVLLARSPYGLHFCGDW